MKLRNGKKLAFIIPAVVAGTVLSSSVAMAAVNYIQAKSAPNASFVINGKSLAQSPRFVSNNTSFVGLWWLQQALKNVGVSATWDGKTFNVTLPQQSSGSSKPPSTNTSVLPAVSGIIAQNFAQGTSTMFKPDDITVLGGNIYVGYQNGVGSKGETSTTGVTNSTIVEYDHTGNAVQHWSITGKCDGLAADTVNNRVVATVNEDGNSSMYIITPGNTTAQHLTYSVDPATTTGGPLATGGGTDSVAFDNGQMFVSASAPAPDANGNFTHAALFGATISGNTVNLTPALMGNASATDTASGQKVTLNLSDADSSEVVPNDFPKYAGDVALDSQGDSELMFIRHPGTSNESVTRLTLGTQIDDSAFATSGKGTLYVTDNAANKIYALSVNAKPGTVFVACPSDSGVAGFVGELDLGSGTITPVALGLQSPQGLLFVPSN